jgi:hypothetical protein
VRPAKLLALLFAAVFLPAAAFTVVGLRSLAADAERAETRYREQAALLANNVDDALRAVIAEVELGGAGCVAFAADAQGSLTQPQFAVEAASNSADDRSLIAVLRTEIDELERKISPNSPHGRSTRSRHCTPAPARPRTREQLGNSSLRAFQTNATSADSGARSRRASRSATTTTCARSTAN